MRLSLPVRIVNQATNLTVCSSCVVASSFWRRLVGLLGKSGIEETEGLLLTPSSGIHTLGMRFPIDVVSLDREGVVTSVHEAVQPWRVCPPSRATHKVLELKSGRTSRCRVRVGDRLLVQEAPQQPA